MAARERVQVNAHAAMPAMSPHGAPPRTTPLPPPPTARDGSLIDGVITEGMVRDPATIPADLWDPARRPGDAAERAGSEMLLGEWRRWPGPHSGRSNLPVPPWFVADGAGRPIHHTCADVWRDVRAMHRIAMARRRKRFAAGALALNKSKLHFRLDRDGEPPLAWRVDDAVGQGCRNHPPRASWVVPLSPLAPHPHLHPQATRWVSPRTPSATPTAWWRSTCCWPTT
jgi:hypothetical protein